MRLGGAEPRRQHESLMRLFAPAVVVPRHLVDMEPRGESIADDLGGETWNGVGWVEAGPERFPDRWPWVDRAEA